MFDHVKCVSKWITLVCHVYDLIYYKMMTIEIYDLKLKDTNAKCVMWYKF